MRELINLIPLLDLTIIAMVLFFIYLGWKHGMPRFSMVVGSLYTGFLLASVYYHLFGTMLTNIFKLKSSFVADMLAFITIDVLATVLMLALLLNIFGHVEIKGRAAIFDKIGGSVLGLVAAVLTIGILVALLRVPYEANKEKVNPVAETAVVQVFNNGYEKSALAPNFIKAAPYFMRSMTPLLPPEARDKGAVPLLQSITAER